MSVNRPYEGRHVPLFFFGSINDLKAIQRHFTRNRPLYGLLTDIYPDSKLTIEEAAGRCVRTILDTQPTGPYNLCGYCFQGYLAFESALQLLKMGEEVSFLGLIDVWPKRIWDTLHLLGKLCLLFRETNPKGRLLWSKLNLETVIFSLYRYAWGYARRLSPKIKDIIWKYIAKYIKKYNVRGSSDFRRLLDIQKNMIADYSIVNYPGRVTLFWATRNKGISDIIYDPTRGWRTLSKEQVIIDVDGKHERLFMEPNCAALARAIEQRLEEEDRENRTNS
jgi:thioesterase domain-containing protein